MMASLGHRAGLRGITKAIPKHPTEPFPASDLANLLADLNAGGNDLVAETLMIPFGMVVLQVTGNSPSQRIFPEEAHAAQAFLFDRPHEPFDMGAEVRRPRGQPVIARCSNTSATSAAASWTLICLDG